MGNQKAVVFITLGYHPAVGGTERQVQALAEGWAAAGKKIWVLTRRMPGTPREEIRNGVRIIRVFSLWFPVLSWITLTLSIGAFLACNASEIGCVIVQMLNVAVLPAALAARLFHIPFLIKPSAGGPDGNLQRMRRSLWGRIKLSVLLDPVSYTIAINKEVAHEFHDAGLSDRKIKPIPNGVDATYFTPAAPEQKIALRKAIQLPLEDVVVLFLGRLEKVKNLNNLIEFWRGIAAKTPSSTLLLVGDGPERPALHDQIQVLGLENKVRLMGPTSDPRSVYQAADFFILPSLREGISNALLEAMACGLPVVVSHVGGNGDVVTPETGYLVDPHKPSSWQDPVEELLKNVSLRLDMGRRARTRVRDHFSADSVLQRYQFLVEQVEKPVFRQPFPILAYHRVCPQAVYGIDLNEVLFDRQMRWLSEQGYRSLTMQDVFARWQRCEPWPSKSVVITFDDGHVEIARHAFPILQKYGLRATVFLNSGLLGKRYWIRGRHPNPVVWADQKPQDFDERSPDWRSYEFMSWDQAKALQSAGWEIGSHGVHHPFLTRLTAEDVKKEVRESKEELQQKFRSPIDFFCYPSGDSNERVRGEVAAAGYSGAVFSPSHYDLSYYWDDPFQFERIGIWQDVAFWKFKALVQGWYPAVYHFFPRTLWRSLRSLYRLLPKAGGR